MADDPDILVDLTTARTEFEANIIVEALRAQGVECQAFTTAGAMLQWDVAATQPMRIQVRRRDLAAAAVTLRAIRAESVDIDWDDVDVGDAKTLAAAERDVMGGPPKCARCGYDLSGLTMPDVCPECGLDLARVAVKAKSAPWPRWLIAAGVVLVVAALVGVVLSMFRREP